MKLVWAETAWQDYLYWQEKDPAVVARINEIIRDAKRSPFLGIGKREPLKGGLQGWWSRRITAEHRFVYRVTGKAPEQTIEVAQCRFHY